MLRTKRHRRRRQSGRDTCWMTAVHGERRLLYLDETRTKNNQKKHVQTNHLSVEIVPEQFVLHPGGAGGAGGGGATGQFCG